VLIEYQIGVTNWTSDQGKIQL